ncbi:MAG: LacI family transcriptional regulator [Lentisphaerae bacterium]|nr:LacI family transcriptional regulator [Lentisphaerota bacterium]
MVKAKKNMSSVAESLGVSRSTVSLVLNGREREARINHDTAERIRNYCREVGYQPNIHSRRMQSKIVRNIMVCVAPDICAPDSENVFSDSNFSGILGGVVTAAARHDVKTSLCLCNFNAPDTRELVFNSFHSREIDGMIYYGMDIPASWSEGIIAEKFNIVGVNSNPVAGISNVDADNYGGTMNMVTEFLLKRGRRNFVYIGGTALSVVSHERYRGFIDALGAYNIRFDEANYIKGDFIEDTAASRLREYLDTASVIPDAVVCANDRMAIGAVRSLLNRGLRVPEDVAVCGSEGIELVDYVNPTIATWNQHSKKIGQRAFELLWDKVNGKEVKNAVVEASLKSGRSIPQE